MQTEVQVSKMRQTLRQQAPSAKTLKPSSATPASSISQNHDVEVTNSNTVEKVAPESRKRKHGKATTIWKHCQRIVSDTWILESAALVLALLCLVAIFVLTGVLANKPLHTWHSYFGINTILSGLGTVMKGGVMLSTATALGQLNWIWFDHQNHPLQDFNIHDEASRGPIGAAKLLCRLNFWHTATLGCHLTILSIFSDAFVQASVQTLTRPTTETSLASIPVCRNMTNCTPDLPSINAAFYDGIYASSSKTSVNSIQGDCVTGNCDYHSSSSIGICSSCYEEPVEAGPLKYYATDGSIWNGSWVYYGPDAQLNLFTYYDGIGFNFTAYNITGHAIEYTEPSAHTRVPLAKYYFLSVRNYSTYLNDGGVRRIPTAYTPLISLNSSNVHTYVQALQCSLSLCAQEITSRMTRGKLTEKIIARELYGDMKPDPALSYVDDGLSYDIFHFDHSSISSFEQLTVHTDDIVSLTVDLEGIIFGGSGSYFVPPLGDGADDWDLEGDTNLELVIYDDVPLRFEHAAEYLSWALRTGSSERHTGTTIGSEAYFDVRWPFLLLPALMVLLAVIFVGIVVWQSTRRGVLLCKTNVLASVVHAGTYVAETVIKQGDLNKLEKISELEEWAEEQKVSLRGGWVDGHG